MSCEDNQDLSRTLPLNESRMTEKLPSDAMRKAIRLLSVPYVGQMVTAHQVVWDEDTMEAVDFNGDSIMSTIVKV